MTEGTGPTRASFFSRCRGAASASIPTRIPHRISFGPSLRLASPRDAAAIQAFVRAFMGEVTPGELTACLSDPESYPHDTILALDGQEVIGIAQLARRTMHFGAASCRVGVVRWLKVQPSLEETDLKSQLLGRLEDHARTLGLHLGLCWTDSPLFYQSHDWAEVYRPPLMEIQVDPFLADLSARGLLQHKRPKRKFSIRPVRRWDISSLASFYSKTMSRSFGAFHRSEIYWDWLLKRRGFDQFYVVCSKDPTPTSSSTKNSPLPQGILGYYVRWGWRLVEALSVPDPKWLSVELLVHACQEAKEQNRNWIVVDLPPDSPLRVVLASGSTGVSAANGFNRKVLLAKIWDVTELLRALLPQFEKAAMESGITSPSSLGLKVGSRRLTLVLDGAQSSVLPCQLSPDFIELTPKEFALLLLGQGDVQESTDILHLGQNCSSAWAVFLTQSVLAPPFFWRSTFDDLPALM